MKTANLIINWLLSDAACHRFERTHSASPLYEGKGTKITTFKLFSELGNIWKCNLGLSKISISHLFYELGKLGNIHSPRPTFRNPNVESMDELGKFLS